MTKKKATLPSAKKKTTLPSAKKKEVEINIEYIFKKFLDNLASVSLYFNKFGTLAIGEDKTIVEQSGSFFKKAFSEFREKIELLGEVKDGKNEEKEIDDSKLERVFSEFEHKLRKQPKISPKNYEILSRSSFLMLNNYFEYLLSDLLSYFYNKYKDSLNEKEFKISLKELNEYETVEEITKQLIVKEIEGIIIEKSFDQLLMHFEKSLSIKLEKELINWDKIIEIRERRHLIVHNSSLVNKKYIVRTKNPYNLKIGEIVHIDNDYFNDALKELKLAGQLLSYNCWGNWDKENTDSAIYEIMMQTFDDLKDSNLDNVCRTCEYAERIEPKNEDQQDCILRIKLNKAIALKMQKKKSELQKTLKQIQIGTATPIFKIAYQILNDDFKGLENNFKKAILLDELNIDYYLDWPIFEFVRTNEKIHKKLILTFENK